jgi:hypothetical protein
MVERAVEISCCDDCANLRRKEGAVWLCYGCTDQGDRDARVDISTDAQAPLAQLARDLEAAADMVEMAVQAVIEAEARACYLQAFMGGTAGEAQFTFNRLNEKTPVIVIDLREAASLYGRLSGRRVERPGTVPPGIG